MLKTCNYELWAQSSTGKPLNFTEFVIDMSLNWGLSGSRATSKVTMAPAAKKQLMNVKRGSQFVLRWGFSRKSYTQVTLYWTSTTWEIGGSANVSIDLVHAVWATARTPVVGIFSLGKVDKVIEKAAKEKGVKVKTQGASKNPGSELKNIAIAQTVAEEIERQYKGQFITADKDGVTLEVKSFENLAQTAQVYYISTEYGYLDRLSVSYKAIVPKDKSYLEMIGGNKTPANTSPNTNPSIGQSDNKQDKVLKPAFPTYALLLNTGAVNTQKNPLLSLVLFANNQEIGRYSCVSGKATKRDSSKTANVLPDGQYTIASKTIASSSAEVGGLFLPITPNFKTNRSALGIHLDPSFNKNNGEDGTSGCIGLTSAADRDTVQKALIENRIKILVVSLNTSPVLTATEKVTGPEIKAKRAHLIIDLKSNQVYSEESKRGVFYSVASLFKLFIAIASVNKLPNNATNNALLSQMLGASSNEAANTLITNLGGVDVINNFCKASGFLKSKLDSLYTNKVDLKQSSAYDLANAFKLIFSDNRYSSLRTYLQGSSLNLPGETHTKAGINSSFEGSVSIIADTAGQKTIVIILAPNLKEKTAILKQIKNKIP